MKSIQWTNWTTASISGNTCLVIDSSITTMWLRRFSFDGVSTYTYISEVAGVSVGTGGFRFDLAEEGFYQMWKSAYPDATGGNEITKFTGGAGKYNYLSNDTLPYLAYDGSDYDATDDEINNLADATSDKSAMNRQSSDARYGLKDDNNQWTGFNDFQTLVEFFSDVTFSGSNAPACEVVPASDSSLTNKEYVDGEIAAIVVTPFQESPNVVRMIPNGSTQTAQVYTSHNAAMGYCKTVASATRLMTIRVEGAGTSTVSIDWTENDGGAVPTGYINDYIHLKAINKSFKFVPPNDTVSCTTLGRVTVTGFQIYKNDSGAEDIVFTNVWFDDCYFDLTVSAVVGAVTFNNCKFTNCSIKVNTDSDASATFTTCKGANVTSNQTLPAEISGVGDKPKADF